MTQFNTSISLQRYGLYHEGFSAFNKYGILRFAQNDVKNS